MVLTGNIGVKGTNRFMKMPPVKLDTFCPFDIPRFRSDGKMFKCDGCGGDPACVKICPNEALKIQ